MSLLVHPLAGSSERAHRLAPPLGTIAGLGLAAVALRVRDPHVAGSWGLCPSAALFGVACPGCGGLRAVNDLTHLDLAAAASSNLLLVLAIPLVALLLGRRVVAANRGTARRATALSPVWSPVWSSRPVLYAGLGLVAAFTLARNLSFGVWLAP